MASALFYSSLALACVVLISIAPLMWWLHSEHRRRRNLYMRGRAVEPCYWIGICIALALIFDVCGSSVRKQSKTARLVLGCLVMMSLVMSSFISMWRIYIVRTEVSKNQRLKDGLHANTFNLRSTVSSEKLMNNKRPAGFQLELQTSRPRGTSFRNNLKRLASGGVDSRRQSKLKVVDDSHNNNNNGNGSKNNNGGSNGMTDDDDNNDDNLCLMFCELLIIDRRYQFGAILVLALILGSLNGIVFFSVMGVNSGGWWLYLIPFLLISPLITLPLLFLFDYCNPDIRLVHELAFDLWDNAQSGKEVVLLHLSNLMISSLMTVNIAVFNWNMPLINLITYLCMLCYVVVMLGYPPFRAWLLATGRMQRQRSRVKNKANSNVATAIESAIKQSHSEQMKTGLIRTVAIKLNIDENAQKTSEIVLWKYLDSETSFEYDLLCHHLSEMFALENMMFLAHALIFRQLVLDLYSRIENGGNWNVVDTYHPNGKKHIFKDMKLRYLSHIWEQFESFIEENSSKNLDNEEEEKRKAELAEQERLRKRRAREEKRRKKYEARMKKSGKKSPRPKISMSASNVSVDGTVTMTGTTPGTGLRSVISPSEGGGRTTTSVAGSIVSPSEGPTPAPSSLLAGPTPAAIDASAGSLESSDNGSQTEVIDHMETPVGMMPDKSTAIVTLKKSDSSIAGDNKTLLGKSNVGGSSASDSSGGGMIMNAGGERIDGRLPDSPVLAVATTDSKVELEAMSSGSLLEIGSQSKQGSEEAVMDGDDAEDEDDDEEDDDDDHDQEDEDEAEKKHDDDKEPSAQPLKAGGPLSVESTSSSKKKTVKKKAGRVQKRVLSGIDILPYRDIALTIYETFVRDGAEHEINIPSRMRNDIKLFFDERFRQDALEAQREREAELVRRRLEREAREKAAADATGAGAASATTAANGGKGNPKLGDLLTNDSSGPGKAVPFRPGGARPALAPHSADALDQTMTNNVEDAGRRDQIALCERYLQVFNDAVCEVYTLLNTLLRQDFPRFVREDLRNYRAAEKMGVNDQSKPRKGLFGRPKRVRAVSNF